MAIEFKDYEAALEESISVVQKVKDGWQRGNWHKTVAGDILNKLYANLSTVKEATDLGKKYIENACLPDLNHALNIAQSLNLLDWLRDLYNSKGMFNSAAMASEWHRDDHSKIKDLFISAGNYEGAFRHSEDPEESYKFALRAGKDELPHDMRKAINLFRRGIEVTKSLKDLRLPIYVATSAVETLAEGKYYAEAVLFAKEAGIEKLGHIIPRDSIVAYERELDFARAALVSEALGFRKEFEFYKGLASWFNQVYPQLPEN